MATIAPGPTTTSPPSGGPSLVRGLVRTARPRQWLKNLLVFAAPAAAGVLGHAGPIIDTLLAFAAFCLAASGTYFVNDARDAAADRSHPRKRNRPVAAGIVPVRLAYLVGAGCLLAGLAVAGLTGSVLLPVTVAIYVGLTTAYSLILKHVVIVDMVAIAAGFVLRGIAGAAAVEVHVSSWFLIVTSLGSLFVVAGKREAELRGLGAGSRPTLELYTPSFLAYVRAMTSGALVVSYCLWALERHTGAAALSFGLSAVPFAVFVLRYAMLIDRGHGEEPENLVFGDRVLRYSGALTVLAIAFGTYAF